MLVEKPITRTIEGADALIAGGERLGRDSAVRPYRRYNPRSGGSAGLDVVVPRVDLLAPFRSELDIDVVLDLMIHDLDIILSLGSPRSP